MCVCGGGGGRGSINQLEWSERGRENGREGGRDGWKGGR